jgi:hypothetical protein
VLSGRGLCDELITRPEESYRLWCAVVFGPKNLMNEETIVRVGPQRQKKITGVVAEPTVHSADRGLETGVLDLLAFVYIVISEMFRPVLGQHCGNHTYITLKLLLAGICVINALTMGYSASI